MASPKERLLGAEMPIHRGLGDLGGARDVVHLHGLVGGADEQVGRGREDAAAPSVKGGDCCRQDRSVEL